MPKCQRLRVLTSNKNQNWKQDEDANGKEIQRTFRTCCCFGHRICRTKCLRAPGQRPAIQDIDMHPTSFNIFLDLFVEQSLYPLSNLLYETVIEKCKRIRAQQISKGSFAERPLTTWPAHSFLLCLRLA